MVRLSLRKKLAFALAANLAILAILEGSARIYLWARSGRAVEEAVIDRHHPLRYDLAPGRSMPSNGAEARIDNFGLRGRDVEVPKTKTRVLCLGDSATFGYAPDVTDDSTYPAWLARDLDRDARGSSRSSTEGDRASHRSTAWPSSRIGPRSSGRTSW